MINEATFKNTSSTSYSCKFLSMNRSARPNSYWLLILAEREPTVVLSINKRQIRKKEISPISGMIQRAETRDTITVKRIFFSLDQLQ